MRLFRAIKNFENIFILDGHLLDRGVYTELRKLNKTVFLI